MTRSQWVSLILVIALGIIIAFTSVGCSSIQVNKDMLVSIDDTLVDKADLIELKHELSTAPRWVNLEKKTDNTTHILAPRTVCRKDASIWTPYKWVKNCKQYLALSDAKTGAVLYSAKQEQTADYKDPLTWEEVTHKLYDIIPN